MKSTSKFQFYMFFIIFTLFSSSAFAGQWKVKSGDNLSSIAANYPGVTYREICKANSYIVKDCTHIEPGWLLVIPEVGDCFDATMTVASKQKARDDWSRRVVSNYQDGKPDCDFGELSKKSDIVPVVINPTAIDEELLNRIDHIDGVLTNHLSMKTEVFVFGMLGSDDTYGIGGLVKYPSDYLVSYQFSNGGKGYANQLLFGKYFSSDLAFMAGPRVENDDNNNSDALGLQMEVFYKLKITDSIFGFVGGGVSSMRVKEYQINGTSNLSLNGSTLTVNTPVERRKNSYFETDYNLFARIAYRF